MMNLCQPLLDKCKSQENNHQQIYSKSLREQSGLRVNQNIENTQPKQKCYKTASVSMTTKKKLKQYNNTCLVDRVRNISPNRSLFRETSNKIVFKAEYKAKNKAHKISVVSCKSKEKINVKKCKQVLTKNVCINLCISPSKKQSNQQKQYKSNTKQRIIYVESRDQSKQKLQSIMTSARNSSSNRKRTNIFATKQTTNNLMEKNSLGQSQRESEKLLARIQNMQQLLKQLEEQSHKKEEQKQNKDNLIIKHKKQAQEQNRKKEINNLKQAQRNRCKSLVKENNQLKSRIQTKQDPIPIVSLNKLQYQNKSTNKTSYHSHMLNSPFQLDDNRKSGYFGARYVKFKI